MMLKLEQVFFGRGPDGYGILGVSPGARPFAARVEALCGGVGTPDGTYGGEPFLLSKPIGDNIVMLCGRRGAPDSAGRETLFFHALVAPKTALVAAKADAFSLFGQGAFADKMPAGEIKPLRIGAKSGGDGSPSRPDGGRIVDASLPCVIRSAKPAHDTVRAIVGARALDLPWATFSFQELSGFDVQVLPHHASIPTRFTEYDDSGNLIRTASQHPVAMPSESEMMTLASRNRTAEQHPTHVDSKHSVMLKLSVAVNAMLAAFCFLLLVSRNKDAKPPLQYQEPPARSDQDSLLEELQGETNRLATALQDANQKIEMLEGIPRGISEAERKDIIADAWKAIIADIPTNDIAYCLECLNVIGEMDKFSQQVPTIRDHVSKWLEKLHQQTPNPEK